MKLGSNTAKVKTPEKLIRRVVPNIHARPHRTAKPRPNGNFDIPFISQR